MMYNVRLKKYPQGVQVQIFDNIVGLSQVWDSSNPVNFVNKETGDFNEDRYKMINDSKEHMKELDVMEYSYPEDIVIQRKEHSIFSSVSRTKQKVLDYARANTWEWFVTLTFNPEKVDSYNYDLVVKKLSKWLNNIRRVCPDLKYIVVPEKHPTSGRWHFHGLFCNCDNICEPTNIYKNGRQIYNMGKYRLGFSTASKISDSAKASNYIIKYCTKEMCEVTQGKKDIGVVAICHFQKWRKLCLIQKVKRD